MDQSVMTQEERHLPPTCISPLLDSVPGGEGAPPPSWGLASWKTRTENRVYFREEVLLEVCLFEDRVSSSPAIRQSCSDSYHLGEGEGAGGRGALPKSRLRPARPRGSRARHLPRTPPIPMFPLRSEGRELPFTELLATASARWLD